MNGYVYVIDNGNLVKVGVSINPIDRISRLEMSGGFKCENVFISDEMERYEVVEKMTHEYLSDKRVVGEWFDVDFSVAVDAVKNEISKIAFYGDDQQEEECKDFVECEYSEFDFKLFKVMSRELIGISPVAAVSVSFLRFKDVVSDLELMNYCNSIAIIHGDKFINMEDLSAFVFASGFDANANIIGKSYVHDLQLENKQ